MSDRLGRPHRPGPGRRPAEALLPARGAHRLHLRHHRRGAGAHRRGGAGAALRRASSGAACARRCARAEPFGTYLGLGITSLIAFQAIVNMAVAMGLLPTKGLTLPFVSYGGSSLIMLMGAAGLLLSVSAHVEGAARAGRRRRASRTRELGAIGRRSPCVRVLIAGGGTGGHLSRASRSRRRSSTRHPENDVVFVGTERGLEARVVPAAGFSSRPSRRAGSRAWGRCRLLQGLLALPLSFFESLADPARATSPTWWWASAATRPGRWCWRPGCCGVPTAVQEQNALPGRHQQDPRAVREGGLPRLRRGARASSPTRKVQLIGNPIRRKLMDNYLRSHDARTSTSRVLVFGGSLGRARASTRG